jgi:hypothetical protein
MAAGGPGPARPTLRHRVRSGIAPALLGPAAGRRHAGRGRNFRHPIPIGAAGNVCLIESTSEATVVRSTSIRLTVDINSRQNFIGEISLRD